jgi:hypothetical protein
LTKSEFKSLVAGCCSTHLVTHSPVVVKIEAVVVPTISLCVSFFEEYRFMFVKRIYVNWIFEGLKSLDQNFNIGSRLQCGKVTSLKIVMKKKF